ncbi:MAG TPA: serine hydrolase domain-containing protein [Solirubrobacter sp.]|nr:serine hydrolase domain-containing protein [Solirubrobacter sp.]
MSAITANRIDQVLQDAVASGAVPNVVAVAADRHGTIYTGAAGPRTIGGDDPVSADSTFRIASMTKLVTTTAALQLIEQGDLEVDAPVERYRPEWAELRVLEGFDGDTPRLRAPRRPATVRHLLTHTSGLAYQFWNVDTLRYEAVTGTPSVTAGRAAAFASPLVADPGTKLEYGISTDWLGRVVEAVSGQTLDAYATEHVLRPLGMERTSFSIDDAQRAQLVPTHLLRDGTWVVTKLDWVREPEYWSGGHGLYSTPNDYLRLQRMLLNGGTLDGVEVLHHETVDAAFTNQIGDLEFPAAIATADPATSADFNVGPGHKFGLGLLLNGSRQPGMREAGSGSWAGLFNTYFWVDLKSGVTGAVYTQTLPFVAPAVFQVSADFERALYASL